MNILVTGSAGFIGFHVTKTLLEQGHLVTGIDNLTNYYKKKHKTRRLRALLSFSKELKTNSAYKFEQIDMCNEQSLSDIFKKNNFDCVINLAAQAGVRYSIDNPISYVNSNLVGFMNLLEACRNSNIRHLVYASSSSVYGINANQPFSVQHRTDNPISLYAATKKSNEVLANSYSHLYKIYATGLRFFTVYGPYGRPDMAYFKFTESINKGEPINLFNSGRMKRDFTYIDDVVDALTRIVCKGPIKGNSTNDELNPFHKIYNVGNNKPVTLKRFIKSIEMSLEKKAIVNNFPMQPGDVVSTHANVDSLIKDYDYCPSTTIEDGMNKFINWYLTNKISI